MELNEAQRAAIAKIRSKRGSQSGQATGGARPAASAPEEDKGFLETLGDRAMMNLTDPERLKSKLRVLGQGALFGGADEAEAAARAMFSDKTYEQELANIRSEMKQFAKEDPTAAITGEILGAVASPAGLVKAPAMLAKLGNLGQATVRSGVGGAAYGFGSAEGDVEQRLEKAKEMGLTSAAIGGVAQKVVAPVAQAIGSKVKTAVDNPLDRLAAKAKASYKAADDSGFQVVSGSLKTTLNEAKKAATDSQRAFNPKLPAHKDADDAYKFVDEMIDDVAASGQPLNLTRLNQIRTNLSDSASSTQSAASKKFILDLRDKIDEMVDETVEGSGNNLWKQARKDWSNYMKANLVANEVEKGITAATTSGSGANVQNTLRQAIKGIINNKNKVKWFTPKEVEMLTKFARGSADENILRAIGKLSPTAGGLIGALHLGGLTAAGATGTLGATLPVQLGLAGAKTLGDVAKGAQSRRLVEAVGGLRPSMARPFQELLPNRAVMPAAIETTGLLGD